MVHTVRTSVRVFLPEIHVVRSFECQFSDNDFERWIRRNSMTGTPKEREKEDESIGI